MSGPARFASFDRLEVEAHQNSRFRRVSRRLGAQTSPPRLGLALLWAVVISWVVVVAGGAPGAMAGTAEHWAHPTMTVRDETGFPEYRRALELAAARWNEAGANVRLVVADGRGAGCSNPVVAEVPVCRRTFSNARVGEAYVWADGGHISRASILIDTRPMPFEHLVAVACHELGHTFGMSHRQESSSCLTAQIHSSEPDARDLAKLRHDHEHVPHPAPPSSSPAPRSAEGESCADDQLVRLGTTCLGSLVPRLVH
jgi:hypothetical protein